MNRAGLTIRRSGIAISSRIRDETTTGVTLLVSHFAVRTPNHPHNDSRSGCSGNCVSSIAACRHDCQSSGHFLGGKPSPLRHCAPRRRPLWRQTTPGKKNPMRPVVELKGRIIQGVRVEEGGDRLGAQVHNGQRPTPACEIVAVRLMRRLCRAARRQQAQAGRRPSSSRAAVDPLIGSRLHGLGRSRRKRHAEAFVKTRDTPLDWCGSRG